MKTSVHPAEVGAEASGVSDLWAQWRRRREDYQSGLGSWLRGLGPVDLLTEMPGNIGDHLIWAGTVDLLESAGVEWHGTPVSAVAAGRRCPALVIPGSGALDSYFNEWLPDLIISAADIYQTVVVLPSKIDPDVPRCAAVLTHPRVVTFAREATTYRASRTVGGVTLALDPAVYFAPFDQLGMAEPPAEGKLVALRQDSASALTAAGYRANPEINNDVSLNTGSLSDWLGHILEVREVVTDRLHVALAAVLMRRCVRFLNPYDNKITDHFRYTFGPLTPYVAEGISVDWLEREGLLMGRRESGA